MKPYVNVCRHINRILTPSKIVKHHPKQKMCVFVCLCVSVCVCVCVRAPVRVHFTYTLCATKSLTHFQPYWQSHSHEYKMQCSQSMYRK